MYVCMYLFIPIFMPLLLLELSIFVHLVIYLPGYDNAHTHRMTHVCVYLICCSSSYTQNHLSVFFFFCCFFLMWFQLYKWIHWIWSINWVNEELNEWTNVLLWQTFALLLLYTTASPISWLFFSSWNKW